MNSTTLALDYVRGDDGLYRKIQHFGDAAEIMIRDASGKQLGVQHITADARGTAHVSTNEQRLRRQGRIFNHTGKCGKLVA